MRPGANLARGEQPFIRRLGDRRHSFVQYFECVGREEFGATTRSLAEGVGMNGTGLVMPFSATIG